MTKKSPTECYKSLVVRVVELAAVILHGDDEEVSSGVVIVVGTRVGSQMEAERCVAAKIW